MTENRKFHFKPFSLKHHRSTMRVGTDAILLGLFAGLNKTKETLEIGTGCGIISLLIASRLQTNIDAIDIDKQSVEEAKENFKLSPYWKRMHAEGADFNQYAGQQLKKYDLVVTNPPFFINDLRSGNQKKDRARHGDSLSYEQICSGTAKLLNLDGILCLVLPYDESRVFIEIAEQKGFRLRKQQIIFPKRGLSPNRVNLQFGMSEPKNILTEKLTLREEDGSFTTEYIAHLKDYYIAVK